MAAADVWTIIHSEEDNNNNAIVPESIMSGNFEAVPSSIRDYFEVIGDRERKCRLCSITIRISAKSFWNLKSHFKTKHPAEWTKIETATKTANSKETTNGIPSIELEPLDLSGIGENNASGHQEFIEDGPVYLDIEFENVDPNMIASIGRDENAKFNRKTFVMMDSGNAHPTGSKRVKFTHSTVNNSLNNNNDTNVSLNECEAADTDGSIEIFNKFGAKKDEHATFGEFIAHELRSMKTDQFRQKLRRIVQKCILDVTEEEDAMLAKGNV